MDAVDALNEIAFWLERSAAPTFKVQAFRKAAGVIADLAADDLAERARDGRLKRGLDSFPAAMPPEHASPPPARARSP